MSANSKEWIRLFVFPLPEVVFFPTSSVPLNIFEPRYLQMIEQAEREGTPIALSFVDPLEERDPEDLHLVVGYGDPNPIVKREDGTRVVLLKGKGKAKLRRVVEREPFLVCDAERVEEEGEVTPPHRFALNRYRQMLHQWLDQNISDDKQRAVIQGNLRGPQAMLECFAMCLLRDADVRQTFLELNSSDERIRFLNRVYSTV